MNTRQMLLLTALASFGSGVLTGLLLAPEPGRASRRRLADKARTPARWVGQRLHAIEAQLTALEHQLETARHELGRRVRTTTQSALDTVVPSVPDDEASWDFERDDVARDLRRMPRR